jgi:hypothetical protein
LQPRTSSLDNGAAGGVLSKVIKKINEQNTSPFQDGKTTFTDFSLRLFSVICDHPDGRFLYRFLHKAFFGNV